MTDKPCEFLTTNWDINKKNILLSELKVNDDGNSNSNNVVNMSHQDKQNLLNTRNSFIKEARGCKQKPFKEILESKSKQPNTSKGGKSNKKRKMTKKRKSIKKRV